MTWEAVEKALPDAKAIAFDECHKIYLAMDDEAVARFREYEYPKVLEVTDTADALDTLHEWFEDSCGLRFISAVATDVEDPNRGFTGLIEQFKLDDEEDEDVS